MSLSPAYGAPGGLVSFGEYVGVFDASSGSFPAANFQGDWFNVTVAGTIDSQPFVVGDILIALVDDPSTSTFAPNWTLVPAPSGGVAISGTPANNQLAVWTGPATIEGDPGLTFDTLALRNTATGGTIRGILAASGGIRNITASATVATLIPRMDDVSSGIGASAIRNLSVILDGDTAMTWQHSAAGDNSIREFHRLTTGIVASATQTQGNGLINGAAFTEVTVVASPDDVITLQAAGSAAQWITIVNTGANRLQIFPSAGDAILPNAGNVSVFLNTNRSITFVSLDATSWVIQAEQATVSLALTDLSDVVITGPSTNQFGLTFDGSNWINRTGITWDTADFRVAGDIECSNADGAAMKNEVASTTNPTQLPIRTDADTGWGADNGTVDTLHGICGGLSCLSLREVGGARQIGFYTTAAISQQTGVAVDAAGIHAACVAIGLFTA